MRSVFVFAMFFTWCPRTRLVFLDRRDITER